MSTPIFDNYRIADISTRYVTEDDKRRLADGETWPIIGTINGRVGALLFIGLDDDEFDAEGYREAGWSEPFIALLRELHSQGFECVRMDADGGHILHDEAFPTFDW